MRSRAVVLSFCPSWFTTLATSLPPHHRQGLVLSTMVGTAWASAGLGPSTRTEQARHSAMGDQRLEEAPLVPVVTAQKPSDRSEKNSYSSANALGICSTRNGQHRLHISTCSIECTGLLVRAMLICPFW